MPPTESSPLSRLAAVISVVIYATAYLSGAFAIASHFTGRDPLNAPGLTGVALIYVGLAILHTLDRIASRLCRPFGFPSDRRARRPVLSLRAFPGETAEALGRSRP